MKTEWKMIRKLLFLILIGQMIPELNAQDLNTIDKASKTEVIIQQNLENQSSVNKTQIQETKIEDKIVEQHQATTPVISETIMKHGMEFSISKINPEEVLDVQRIVSPDELKISHKNNEEYFNKKYLNKEVVIIGPFYSISRHSRNYKLKIDKFDNGPFTLATSCYFSRDQKENLKTFLRLLTLDQDYVLVKGTLESRSSIKNCRIIGFAKFKI